MNTKTSSEEPYGALLRRLRLSWGWSQAELGERMGLAPSAVSRREAGLTQVSLAELKMLADSIGWSVGRMLEHHPDDNVALARRIRMRRKELGISQTELAEKLGIGQSAMSRIETGEVEPSGDTLDRLIALLNLEESDGSRHTGTSGSVLPLVNRVSAGNLVDYEEYGVTSRQASSYIDAPIDANGDLFFALEVVGDSMEPSLFAGDVIVLRWLDPRIDAEEPIADGRIVYVRFAPEYGEGGFLARWNAECDSRVLTKDNPKYRPKVVKPEAIEQLALVVERRTRRL